MIRLLLMRAPRSEGQPEAETLESAIAVLGLLAMPLRLVCAPSNAAALGFASAMSGHADASVEIEPLVDDFDAGRSRPDFRDGMRMTRGEGSSESLETFHLRLRLWLKRLEERPLADEMTVVLANGGTLELMMACLCGLVPEGLARTLFALDPFHAHVWTGAHVASNGFTWCLRASNALPRDLKADVLPFRGLAVLRGGGA